MPARGETSIRAKDFDPPKIENSEEKEAAQKLVAHDSNDLISLSAICIGLLSLAMMLGVRLRRGLQPATVLASSGELGLDMPMNTASAVGDNALETRPANNLDSSSVGWGQLPSQNSRPLTLLYAKKPGPKVDTKNIAWRALELTRDTAYAIGDLAERAGELAAEEPEEDNAPGLLEKAKKRADTIKKLP